MITKDERRLRIALVGCGPISQAAHLDAIRKASDAELFAICDFARDLTARIAAIYQPELVYNQFSDVLADPNVDAVVIAVADQFPCATVQIRASRWQARADRKAAGHNGGGMREPASSG